MKQKKYILKNRSAMIESISPMKDDEAVISNFSVKKICRIKRFAKFSVKDIKHEEIFTKIQNIQNPLHRQNINLPKI